MKKRVRRGPVPVSQKKRENGCTSYSSHSEFRDHRRNLWGAVVAGAGEKREAAPYRGLSLRQSRSLAVFVR